MYSLPLLWAIAISMAFSSAWLLRRSSIAKSSLVNAIVFYILVMMAGMFAGAVLYFAQPSLTGIAEALGLNMVIMSVGVIAVLHNWTGHEGATEDEKIATEKFGTPSDELELKRAIAISRAYVVYFLVMMASMSAVGFVYIFDTAVIGLDEGLLLGNVIMVPGIVAILWYASKHPNDINESYALTSRSIKLERWTLVFLVLLNEFFMGWAFVLASEGYGVITNGSFLGIAASTFNNVTGSDWFLFTLSLEVIFSLYILRKFFSMDFIKVASLQSLILVFVPTAIGGRVWTTLCVFAELAILAGLIILSYRQRNRSQNVPRYLRLVLILDSLVVVGSLIWIVSGNVLILYACLVGEAVIYFSAILERIGLEKEKKLTAATTTSPRMSGQPATSGTQAAS